MLGRVTVNPATPILGIYPRDIKINVCTKTVCRCSYRVIHNSQKWKKFKYLASCEWINKMWYVYKMKLSLAVKKSKTLTYDAIDESKSIMLTEKSATKSPCGV
jgi:hypothetical protein